MRRIFIESLVELAEKDPRIILLTGDLGYTVVEIFAEKFPDRFFNAGVAEQNMIGVATGLAEAGFIPFAYSITTFATLRAYEFIRNGPIVHRLPVRIIGVGAGFDYGSAGKTHFGLEDLGVMRIQPGINVIAPADFAQARNALFATWNAPDPIYYRLERNEELVVSGLNGRFELGKAQKIRNGSDLIFIATGSLVNEVVEAANILIKNGITCCIVVVARLVPEPTSDLIRMLSSFSVGMTVEEHYVVGGLGSYVCEIVAEYKLKCRIVRCGVKNTSRDGILGNQIFMRNLHELSGASLARTASYELKRKNKCLRP